MYLSCVQLGYFHRILHPLILSEQQGEHVFNTVVVLNFVAGKCCLSSGYSVLV